MSKYMIYFTNAVGHKVSLLVEANSQEAAESWAKAVAEGGDVIAHLAHGMWKVDRVEEWDEY